VSLSGTARAAQLLKLGDFVTEGRMTFEQD
jgi:hypothetical protein